MQKNKYEAPECEVVKIAVEIGFAGTYDYVNDSDGSFETPEDGGEIPDY